MITSRVRSLHYIQLSLAFCLLFTPLQLMAGQQDYISISSADCANSLKEYESRQSKGAVKLDCKSYLQTTNYTCGPAVVMTLLRYYRKMDAGDMNQKTELRIALEMGATGMGTTKSQVANWLSNHGMRVRSGTGIDSETLIKNIKRGIPTIVGIDEHSILAKGVTSDGNEIIFSDSCCDTKTISRNDIDTMWAKSKLARSHCPGNDGQYIVATPR